MLRRLLMAAGVGSSFTPFPTAYSMLYNGQNGSGIVYIGLATSTDSGVTWTRYGSNPVLSPGSSGQWDDEQVHSPSVLWDGSQYVMYYGGYDGATYKIGRATSSDLITWTKDAGNPVLSLGSGGSFDDTGVLSPRVYFDNSASPKWKMWYVGVKSTGDVTTGFADGSDGISWTKRGKVVATGGVGTFYRYSAAFATPVLVGSTWYLYGAGQANASAPVNTRSGYVTVALGSEGTSAAYSTPTIISAFSGDITSLDDGLTYMSNVAFTSVVLRGSTYIGYGTAFHPNPDISNHEVSLRSTSTDLVNWTTPTGVLLPTASGTFDTLSAENPAVVVSP